MGSRKVGWGLEIEERKGTGEKGGLQGTGG